MADAEPRPQATEVVKQIDVAKITNQEVRRFLNLKKEDCNMMDSLDDDVLESYFGKYSPFAKAYQMHGGKNVFFHDVVKCLLEVTCVSPRQYCMPKQWARLIITTYEGSKVDWGYIIGITLIEQLHDKTTRLHSEVEGSHIPLSDSLYKLINVGDLSKQGTLVSYDQQWGQNLPN